MDVLRKQGGVYIEATIFCALEYPRWYQKPKRDGNDEIERATSGNRRLFRLSDACVQDDGREASG